MGATESVTAGLRNAVIRPRTVILGVLVALLLVDFVGKLLWVEIWAGPYKLLGGQLPIARLLTLVWDGVVIGLAIGLAGIGLSLTYSILTFANFAHGDYITSGSFAGWAVTFLLAGLLSGQGDPGYLLSVGAGQGPSPGQLGINIFSTPLAIVVGLVVAILGTIALTLVTDRLVYKPLRDEGAITLLISSIGVALVLRYLVVFMFGGTNRGLTAGGGRVRIGGENGAIYVRGLINPPQGSVHTIFDVTIPVLRFGGYSRELLSVTSNEAALVVIALVLMGGVHVLLQRTKLGKSMRAMADNKDLARVTGIPTERVIQATWIIGGAMAGASGYLIALERGTLSFNLGWILLLLIFAAVILGGIGSVYGAMVGGVVIGLTSSVSLIWIPSSFSTVAAFAIMILMLLFKPDGLFGGVTTA